MEYKYSLFGNFVLNENSANQFCDKFGKGFKRRIENELVRPFPGQQNIQLLNVYVLEKENVTIKMGNSRIDFIFKKNDMIQYFKELYSSVISILPDKLLRLAINVNYAKKDSNKSILKKISLKAGPVIQDAVTSEFFIRKNLTAQVSEFNINNIITIQNGIVKDDNEFSATHGLIFSIDINTALNPNQLSLIDKNKALSIIEALENYCNMDFDLISEFIGE